MNLKDKVALVTGGSRGIGRACCAALAEKGCNVAVNYNSSADKAQEVVKEIEGKGGKALAVKADVSDSQAVAKMVEQVKSELGPISILVNNAGVYFDKGRKLADMTDEQWDSNIAVNLTSTFLCCRAVVKDMIDAGEGKIVIIGSCAGVAGQWTVGYCAAKSAQMGFTMSLARELREFNVHVNLVAPGGAIDTDMHARWLPGSKKKLEGKMTPSGHYPLSSGIAPPEDIAHAVVFMAENDHVDGEILKVSGGTCICP